MTSTVPRRTGRARPTAVFALAAVVLASGCSSDALDGEHEGTGSDRGWGAGHPLLREDDVGLGYRDDPPSGEDGDLTRAGCLSAVDALGTRAVREMAATFTTDNPLDSLVITHTVLEYDDGSGSADALAGWQDTVTNCDTVEYAQQDSTLRLDVVTDTERHGQAVTEEVNLIATGQIDSDSVDVDVSQWVSVAQVGNHLSVVQVLDFDDSDAIDEGRRLARLTADRLAAWTG